MSGLYIPNREMPGSCYKCEIDCGVVPYLDRHNHVYGRFFKCPLILIPDHGRCIDADAATAKCDGPTIYDLTDVPEFLKYEPTMLPAEKERS